jgi:hypothetical protein
MARRLISSAAASDGVMLIELLAAILVLAVGALTTFGIFDASQRANRVSELHEAEVHLAQGELERVESLPFSQVGLKQTPATSTDANQPGFYVTGSGCGATFRWNQSGTGTDPLVIKNCTYTSTGVSFPGCSPVTQYCNGTVPATTTVAATPTSPQYTISDYVTWAQDPVCVPTPNVCPLSYDYKRVTIEVTNSPPNGAQPASLAAADRPIRPVLVSSIVADPHAIPLVGNPNVNNPLNNPGTTCTDANGNPIVPCNNGLGGQTANTFYLTDSPEQSGYSAPSGDNACMHYTNRPQPPTVSGVYQCGSAAALTCSLQQQSACPAPDLLSSTVPPSSIPQEYNFSPNLSATKPGRVILRDPAAVGSTNAAACAVTPSPVAQEGELWATQPLASQLTLSGNGGMTLYTNTLTGAPANVTMCVGVYLELPPPGVTTGLLDPLNLLCGSCSTPDSTLLGTGAFTNPAWPGALTPVSLTFSNLFSAHTVPAGDSIAVRIWFTSASGDDVVVQYDAPTVRSSVQINSQ